MHPPEIVSRPLGQAGFRFDFDGTVVYVDPYLSNRVAELEGAALQRQIPIPEAPDNITDADWILLSHIHLDHCDLATLLPMARASAAARIMCPADVARHLVGHGLSAERLRQADEKWHQLGPGCRVIAVPAAHPELERDADGLLRYAGYVIEHRGRRLYHAGDTSVHEKIIDTLCAMRPIDVAFLPVNERNFYRERRGIIGNMTVREAFQFALDIEARVMVPIHWDMFAPNAVYAEEIRLLYDLMRPAFEMRIRPERI